MSVRSTTSNDHTVAERPNPTAGPAAAILISSPVAFVLVVAVTMAIVTTAGLASLADITPAEFSGGLWAIVARGATYVVAVAWGATGTVLLTRRLTAGETAARTLALATALAAALSVLAAVGQVVIPLMALGFQEARFGDTRFSDWLLISSILAIWFAIVATGLAAWTVRRRGVRPGAMLVITVICGVYLVADIATRGGFPPFVIAFVWLAMGLLLRDSRR